MLNRTFLFVFFLVAAAEILIQVVGLQEFNLFIKPLIVPSLAALYFQNVNSKNALFVIALLFCWAGDLFLLFDHVNELYFMGGLGSFLVAHILLIFLYGNLKLNQGKGFSGPQKARVSFPIILAGTGLIAILNLHSRSSTRSLDSSPAAPRGSGPASTTRSCSGGTRSCSAR